MRWPWVSRTHHEAVERQYCQLVEQSRRDADSWRTMADWMRGAYSEILAKYHELTARSPALAPKEAEPVEVPQPDVPPAEVLAAIRQISPIKDKTFEANWAYWERHKAQAAQHPAAFADDILNGASEG